MDVITLAMAKGYADEKLETAKAYTDKKLAEVGGNGGGQNGNTNNQSGAGIPHIELTTSPLGELPTDLCSFLDEQLEKRQTFSCTFPLVEDEYGTTMIFSGVFSLVIVLSEGEVQQAAFALQNGTSQYGFIKTEGVWTFMIQHDQ